MVRGGVGGRKGSGRTSRPAPRLSVRAFGKRLGVSHTAVQKAIAKGRITEASLGRDQRGQFIADPQLAEREWAAGAAKPGPNGDPSLAQAQVRVAQERADALRLTNEQRRARLIDAGEARREAFECARAVRDAVLNVPGRLAAELAGERDVGRVRERLDKELRAALEAMAEVLANA